MSSDGEEGLALAWQCLVLLLGVMLLCGAELWVYWFWLAAAIVTDERIARFFQRNG